MSARIGLPERTIELGVSTITSNGEVAVSPPAVDQSIRAAVERVVDVRWVETDVVMVTTPNPGGGARIDRLVVADPELVDLLGLDAADREVLRTHDIVVPEGFEPGVTSSDRWFPGFTAGVLADGLDGWQWLISPAAVADRGLQRLPGTVLGALDRDLTRAQYDELVALTFGADDASYFRDDSTEDHTSTYVNASVPVRDWRPIARWAVTGAVLLLVLGLVGIGLALRAAEGRDERDTMISLGAPPKVLARTAGWSAWLLALTGALLGVPFGWLVLRVCLSAARGSAPFPTLVVLGVVVAVPAVASTVAWAGSALAQRCRPLGLGAMATE